jgi:acid phosphatase family membrane protein YuiD
MIALLHDGMGSVTFAIAVTFSLLFAYDAMNVRFQTGKHAEFLNTLRKDFPKTLQDNNMEAPRGISAYKKIKLRERLGHTPFEVFGGILFGIVLTFVFYYLFYV